MTDYQDPKTIWLQPWCERCDMHVYEGRHGAKIMSGINARAKAATNASEYILAPISQKKIRRMKRDEFSSKTKDMAAQRADGHCESAARRSEDGALLMTISFLVPLAERRRSPIARFSGLAAIRQRRKTT